MIKYLKVQKVLGLGALSEFIVKYEGLTFGRITNIRRFTILPAHPHELNIQYILSFQLGRS